MGGPGSTRWKDYQKAPVVEDCHQLDVSAFEPAFRHNQTTGVFKWTNPRGEVTAEFAFSLGPISEDGSRALLIEPSSGGRKQSFQLQRVQRGWYSGWLFHCPSDCGRRVRKLYALPKWMVFGCRQCAGLTYRSVQQHDSRLDLALRDPWAFKMARSRAPETSNSRLVTARLTFTALERATKPRKGRSCRRKKPAGRIARGG
jgi:hypothetical protein